MGKGANRLEAITRQNELLQEQNDLLREQNELLRRSPANDSGGGGYLLKTLIATKFVAAFW